MEAIQARIEGHRRRLGGLSLWRLQHKDRGRRRCWGRLMEREREREMEGEREYVRVRERR